MPASERRQRSYEIYYIAGIGAALVGFVGYLVFAAATYRPEVAAPPKVAGLEAVPPPRPDMPLAAPAPSPTAFAIATPPALDAVAPRPQPVAPPARLTAAPPARLAPAPQPPPSRPAVVAVLAQDEAPVPLPPRRDTAVPGLSTAPVSRPLVPFLPPGKYDSFTAVYDLSAHMVYLPNGQRLEAHSGLGEFLDDPRRVNEKDRGPTPPHLYELTLRESLFHGVQALRLNPIGEGEMYGRDGLLTHTYMLGERGDSNGCVSFKDYEQFLAAYQGGQVKRLAVVTSLSGGVPGREFASTWGH